MRGLPQRAVLPPMPHTHEGGLVAVNVSSVNAGPLGRRWVAHCDVCKVKLPGRFADPEQAEQVASTHENERHLARIMANIERGTE